MPRHVSSLVGLKAMLVHSGIQRDRGERSIGGWQRLKTGRAGSSQDAVHVFVARRERFMKPVTADILRTSPDGGFAQCCCRRRARLRHRLYAARRRASVYVIGSRLAAIMVMAGAVLVARQCTQAAFPACRRTALCGRCVSLNLARRYRFGFSATVARSAVPAPHGPGLPSPR